jgi:hypothetical protein
MFGVSSPTLPPCPLYPVPSFGTYELDRGWGLVMRVYPETRLIRYLAIADAPIGYEGYYATTQWGGDTIVVFPFYRYVQDRWLLSTYAKGELAPDELLAHELRHVHQMRLDGMTSDLWDSNLMEADAYAEIARYRERKSQGR